MRAVRLAVLLLSAPLTLALAGSASAADGITVVNEGGIRDRWMLAPGVPLAVPQYPPQFARRHDTVCIGVGYLLKPDGTTSDFALLKGWTSAGNTEPESGYWQAFAESAGDALKQWRFQPRPEIAQAKPVYTVATFVFGGQPAQHRSKCAVPNLIARLRELKAARDRRTAAGDVLDDLDLNAVDARGTDVAGTRTYP
ncbi:hypothetical protein [Noviluteimonas gilva]|uniref:TonB C-terminal domain-containing protein n=1 Tax=Noviluteimonas gilva TaxID=2682097 RepID=A0A7C9HK60_9GAMM|nr:hypothetical protein [Lysobacter gilvus]MUV12636.1 hypothetical protein [Lysobacter gilvus]